MSKNDPIHCGCFQREIWRREKKKSLPGRDRDQYHDDDADDVDGNSHLPIFPKYH